MSLSKNCVIISEQRLKQDVKLCCICLKKTPIDRKQSAIYEWSMRITCNKCKYEWFECTHHASTNYMKTNKQLLSHHNKFHTVTNDTNEEIITVTKKRKHSNSALNYISLENQK